MFQSSRFFLLAALILSASFLSPSIAQQPPPKQIPANAITQAALKAGVQACAARINQVTNFVGGGSQVGSFLFVPPAKPDQMMVSLSLELVGKDKNSVNAYASASFAPNQANGCGAVYEAVAYWPQKCGVVASKYFGDMSKGRQLQKNITVLEGNTPTRVFLMPAGSGCVSIKKEVVM